MKASTQIYLAAALLHRERGIDAELEVGEVVARAEREGWGGVQPQTLRAHASTHCLATARPSPAHLRMLTRTNRGRVRLFRQGDHFHAGRADGPTEPALEDVPVELRPLVDWVRRASASPAESDPLMALARRARQSGIWKGINPDRYVRKLREGWK